MRPLISKQKMKKKTRNLGNLTIMVLVAGIMYWLNHWVGYMADDYTYHFFYQSAMPHTSTRTFHSFFDIVPSMVNHWHIWNGRIVAHTIVQWFMQGSKLWFNILNAGAFVLLGVLIGLLAYRKWERITPFKLGWIYGLLFLFIPQFGLTILWVSGSGNYLWTSLIYLTFLLPFRLNWRTRTIVQAIVAVIGMVTFGFLAGATNENSGPATLLIAILIVLYQWQRGENRPQLWQVMGIIAGIAGSCFMILAPGSVSRNSQAIKMQFADQLYTVSMGSVMFIGLLLIAIIIIGVYAYVKGVRSFERYSSAGIFMLGAIGSVVALLIPSELPSRLWFGTTLYILLSLFTLVEDTAIIVMQNKRAIWLINGMFALLCLVTFTSVNATVKSSGMAAQRQVVAVKQAKLQGKTKVVMPKIPQSGSSYDPYSAAATVGRKPHSWINRWFAKFYQVNEVQTRN